MMPAQNVMKKFKKNGLFAHSEQLLVNIFSVFPPFIEVIYKKYHIRYHSSAIQYEMSWEEADVRDGDVKIIIMTRKP